MENESLKAEIQTLQDAKDIATENENLKAEIQTLKMQKISQSGAPLQ